MLALTNVANVFIIPLAAMIDSFVMNIIKTNNIDSSFGMQRVFGSIGFGFTSYILKRELGRRYKVSKNVNLGEVATIAMKY